MNTENNSGLPFEMKMLNASLLVSGLPYQREVEDKDVKQQFRDWDIRLMEPLVVSYRSGKYYLVEGQHRFSYLCKQHSTKDFLVPCKVLFGLTYEDEAELCYKLDKAKRRLTLAESVSALIESGKDATVMDVLRIIEDNGFIWALDAEAPEKYHIKAVRAVLNAYKLLGGDSFDRMLYIIAAAWEGNIVSLQGNFISGMALFMKTYENELVDRIAIERLSKLNPEMVIREGKKDYTTNQAALRFARVLLEGYNMVHRGGKKLEYRFKR